MASCDYRLCDVCGGKAFYDSNLIYGEGGIDDAAYRIAGKEQKWERLRLDHLGDWAVLCEECSKTHRTQIVPIAAPQAEPCIGSDPVCPCQDGDACHYRDTATTKAGHGCWGVALCVGAQSFALSAKFETLTEADEYAETLRTALGIGDSDADR